MARALTILCDRLQRLTNKIHVALINVESEQPEATGGAATDTVQELQCLTHKVVVGLVVLVAQEVLDSEQNIESINCQCFHWKPEKNNSVPAGLNCGSHRAAAGSGGSVS